jgi:hypothetical protein
MSPINLLSIALVAAQDLPHATERTDECESCEFFSEVTVDVQPGSFV